MMYSLETLVLDNNLIQTVEAVLFGRNYALIHLSLKNTKINAIQSTFLENLVQISYLDLSENSCVNEVITVDREKLEEVYAILARCFENFDFDPNLTSTDEPPSISTDSSEVPSTGVIETTTSHARTNISAIFNLSVIVFTGVFSRLHFFN